MIMLEQFNYMKGFPPNDQKKKYIYIYMAS